MKGEEGPAQGPDCSVDQLFWKKIIRGSPSQRRPVGSFMREIRAFASVSEEGKIVLVPSCDDSVPRALGLDTPGKEMVRA